MNAIQLDFWTSPEECEIAQLRKEIKAQGESLGKIRRGLYARNGELTKQVFDLTQRLELLERNICKGGK